MGVLELVQLKSRKQVQASSHSPFNYEALAAWQGFPLFESGGWLLGTVVLYLLNMGNAMGKVAQE